MEFVRVVNAAIASSGRRAYVYIALTSIGTLLISIMVNSVADYVPEDGPNYELFVAFILVCAMTVVARSETTRVMNAVGEGIAHHMRAQFAGYLCDADVAGIEQIGAETIRSTLARNAQILAESPAVLSQGVASAITFVLATIYVATLSVLSALAVVALTVVVVMASRLKTDRARAVMAEGQKAEREFYDSFSHLLDGIKEARMDRRRTEDLFDHFLNVRAREARAARLNAIDSMIAFGVLVFASFYLLLGTVTFITPQFVDSAATAMKVVYTTSVMWLLIEGLLRIMPTILRGDAAFSELRHLETQLRACRRSERIPSLDLPPLAALSLDAVSYTYARQDGDSAAFGIGPCSLDLRPGEVVFVVGGNGSGKTTLLRNLCMLYQPTSGRVLWNGIAIGPDNVVTYRQRISAIFADFHLFDRIYGNREVDPATVEAALARVDLSGKTQYRDGRFTSLNLSTGQRKRLALALALIEDREIMVFDEIAAEQDPAFRRRIYHEFLPALREQGKAVLVITHDDRYFDQADRIYYMTEGQLSLQTP